MATPTTIEESIERTAIQGKQRVQVAGETVELLDIDKQIKAATFVATRGLSARDLLGNSTRLIPGPRD